MSEMLQRRLQNSSHSPLALARGAKLRFESPVNRFNGLRFGADAEHSSKASKPLKRFASFCLAV